MSRIRDARGWLLALGLLVMGLGGCHPNGGTPKTPAQPFRGLKLVVGAVGEPAILTTLASQRGEWSETRQAEVVIRESPIDLKSAEGVDLVLFRGDRLGDLVDIDFLAAIPESAVRPPPPSTDDAPAESSASKTAEPPADPLQFSDVVPADRDQVSKYGSDRMALPYGGSALVLAYHRAAFQNEANRKAASDAKLTLEPPATWEQFDSLAKFFQGRDWNGDGKPDFGVALALGPDPEGVGDATFLARAASLGQHRDQFSFLFDAETMVPRIDSPPFVAALGGLVDLKGSGPPDLAKFDAEAARQAFAKGRAAILIDRAEQLARWGDAKAIGVAPLPGSGRVYDPSRAQWVPASPPNLPSYLPLGGGWLIGVSRATSGVKREAALDFARYLIGPDISNRVRADRGFPMLPVRTAQLSLGPPDPGAAPGVDGRQWSDAISRTLLAERVVPGLRIPEADGYLADLAKGRAAAMGGTPADRALHEVSKAWAERTKRLGTARQTWHYRRSLNTLATLPEPPDR